MLNLFRKSKNNNHLEHVEMLILAQTTLLASLVEEMSRQGTVDGKRILSKYEEGLDLIKKELSYKSLGGL